MCVCVCVCERERERGGGDRHIERYRSKFTSWWYYKLSDYIIYLKSILSSYNLLVLCNWYIISSHRYILKNIREIIKLPFTFTQPLYSRLYTTIGNFSFFYKNTWLHIKLSQQNIQAPCLIKKLMTSESKETIPETYDVNRLDKL